MSTTTGLQLAPSGALRERRRWEQRVRRLAWVSLAWHVAEGVVAVWLGAGAGSVALLGFGADSGIEALAGGVVLWRLTGRRRDEQRRAAAERRAAKLVAVTFALLAAYVAVHATVTLVDGHHPGESMAGAVLAAVTLVLMPPLGVAKQRAGRRAGSCAAESEGAQNLLCAYLSAGLLVGLGANAWLGWWWADPVVALVLGAVALREARGAWRGELDCC